MKIKFIVKDFNEKILAEYICICKSYYLFMKKLNEIVENYKNNVKVFYYEIV